MDLNFDKSVASAYKSPTQRARVLTESWIQNEMFCPGCGQPSLDKYANNDPVRDFGCATCHEDFELKAKRNALGRKIVDGGYRSMIRRLTDNKAPNLFVLTYTPDRNCVRDLVVIPSHFFAPQFIERRRPLARTARRAGWIGCNILYSQIPKAGRVDVVIHGVPVSKSSVMAAWQRTIFLRDQKKPEVRGWTLDVMRCIEQMRDSEFDLAEVYGYEGQLAKLHSQNRHVRAKIRQQLQVLRDAGYLEFLGRGRYRVA